MESKYGEILANNLGMPLEEIKSTGFSRGVNQGEWSSFVHYGIIVDLEEAFGVRFGRNEILDFIDYKSGLDILRTLVRTGTGGNDV